MLRQLGLVRSKKHAKNMSKLWTRIMSSITTITFIYTIIQTYLPSQLRLQIKRYVRKLTEYFHNYVKITFHEFDTNAWFKRSKAFASIEQYLREHASSQVKRLNARVCNESDAVVLSMADYEEVTDSFQEAKVWWRSVQVSSTGRSISIYPRGDDQTRYFTLTFHKKHKELVTNAYLKYVLEKGKDIQVSQRQRKLFTNNKNESGGKGSKVSLWSHVLFNHPACFETLAMEAKKKKEITDDLETFSKSKEYYRRIGKAWKRGYLLYGPPGTGKSTMIAAMANFLKYDVYDIELTAVKDNTELRRLLIDTSNKSIVVIEDIDCSIDLTGHREKQKDAGKTTIVKEMEDSNKNSKVTLSGLLNCIDGLWSTCGEEKIFVFTTNYVDKLDPALIRRGRMDKHIELSYCCFESFKVLAKNYLNLDSHEMFPTVEKLLEETKMTPADIADTLMPKAGEDNDDSCLERLVEALHIVKEEARLKAEEEQKEKAEEEERLKAEEEEKEELRRKEAEEKELHEILKAEKEKIKKSKAVKIEREKKIKQEDMSTPKLWGLSNFLKFGV